MKSQSEKKLKKEVGNTLIQGTGRERCTKDREDPTPSVACKVEG